MKRDKKTAKQTKQKKKKILSFIKENKLNWHIFNLLENLLIFCTVPSRRAPQESGVSFYRIHLASFFIMEKIKQRENGNVLK
jgi:hypothetical protein